VPGPYALMPVVMGSATWVCKTLPSMLNMLSHFTIFSSVTIFADVYGAISLLMSQPAMPTYMPAYQPLSNGGATFCFVEKRAHWLQHFIQTIFQNECWLTQKWWGCCGLSQLLSPRMVAPARHEWPNIWVQYGGCGGFGGGKVANSSNNYQ